MVTDQAAIIRSTYPKYEGCSGWINSPDFPLPLDEEAYINYSVEVPDQHVGGELEYTVWLVLLTETEAIMSVCRR